MQFLQAIIDRDGWSELATYNGDMSGYPRAKGFPPHSSTRPLLEN